MILARWAALVALASLTFSTVALSQSTPVKPAPRLSAAAADSVVQETADYGAWLLRLDEAAAPAMAAARSLQADWGAAMRPGNPAETARTFRPTIARGLQAVATARAQITAVDTPTFARLNLPPDLQSAALRNQMLQTVNQLEVMVQGFDPLLDAMIANDQRAAISALSQIIGSTRTLYETQLLFARANLATSEAGSPDYSAAEFEVAYFETGSRLIDAASRVIGNRRDPTLSADLLRFADRIDRIANDGARASTLRKQENLLAIGDADTVESRRVLQQVNRIDEQLQGAILLWRGFADTIRRGGQAASQRPAGFRELRVMTDALGPLRQQLDAIATRQAELLADLR